MTTFDLSPLFRTSIGFDHLNRVLESAARFDEAAATYPPYNIEALDEDAYRIVIAVAGFKEGDINVSVENNTLTVSGRLEGEDDKARFLHRGIAGRAFERRFQLADHIEVKAARLENGLLEIDLVREVPEALKPRTIAVESGKRKRKFLDSKAA